MNATKDPFVGAIKIVILTTSLLPILLLAIVVFTMLPDFFTEKIVEQTVSPVVTEQKLSDESVSYSRWILIGIVGVIILIATVVRIGPGKIREALQRFNVSGSDNSPLSSFLKSVGIGFAGAGFVLALLLLFPFFIPEVTFWDMLSSMWVWGVVVGTFFTVLGWKVDERAGNFALFMLVVALTCMAGANAGKVFSAENEQKVIEAADKLGDKLSYTSHARLRNQAKAQKKAWFIEVVAKPGEKVEVPINGPYYVEYGGLVAINPKGYPQETIYAGKAQNGEDLAMFPRDGQAAYLDPIEYLHKNPAIRQLLARDIIYERHDLPHFRRHANSVPFEIEGVHEPVTVRFTHR